MDAASNHNYVAALMSAIIPTCRWRLSESAGSICSSVRISGGKTPFDAATVCINKDGTPCSLANHDEVEPPSQSVRQTDLEHGPGTELGKMLEAMGVTDDQGCQCKARIAQMNFWGVRGCRSRRLMIASWIREAAIKRIVEFTFESRVEEFLPMVDEAIRLADVGTHGDSS